MGISNHERASPVIDHPQPQHHHDDIIMNERYHHPWQGGQQKRQQPPEPQSSDEDEDKHVSFADCQVREYTQVLGDHPCCTQGPPVTLGWDYTDSPAMTVERYEATHPRRRSRTDLKLSFEDRREILSAVPEADVRRVQRRLSRERCAKGKTMKSFFGVSSE